MFAVFPDGTQPVRKQTSPWIFVAAGCGGCALIGLLFVVGIGFFAVNKGKGMIQDIMQQPKIAQEILTHLQNHEYDQASLLFKPSAQEKYSSDVLKKLIESKESKLGKINSILKSSDTDTNVPPSNSLVTTYRSQMIFEKGKLNAIVTFRSKDPLHPIKGADDIELNESSNSKVKVHIQGDAGTSVDVNVDTDAKVKTTK